ncbi:MAG: hypothetical protein JNL79_40725 [Myxococcales bacterium]|nr:hypothetical protein [Myxococcales bacterium]
MRPLVLFALLGLGCHDVPAASHAEDAASHDAADVGHVGEVAVETGGGFGFGGPLTLRETGLYADLPARRLAAGVVEYTVRYELWTDGLAKRRFVWLPASTRIDTTDADHWTFPVGTKTWIELGLSGAAGPLETRYMVKLPSGKWDMVSYVWGPGGVATAAPAGRADLAGSGHEAPSTEQCHICHDGVRDAVAGLGVIQLGAQRIADKPALAELFARGLLDREQAPVDPPGPTGIAGALGYLHANCGTCHNDVGIWSGVVPLRLRLRIRDDSPEATGAYQTTVGKVARHVLAGGIDTLVVPGNPEQSQLWVRLGARGYVQMPPIGTKIADASAVALVKEWIAGMK